MTQDEISAVAEQIQKVCPPECSVQIVPTKQQNEICLVVIQVPSMDMVMAPKSTNHVDWGADRLQSIFKRNPVLKTVYYWEVNKIHNFHYETILPLFGNTEHFRALYCCGGKFVFYTHTLGCLKDGANIFDYIGMNDRNHYKYIGNCRNIDLLIGFLMTTYATF